MVEVIWSTKDLGGSISLQKEIDYQRAKYVLLRDAILQRYKELGSSHKYFPSHLKFNYSKETSGFLIGLVLNITQRKDHYLLKIVDFESLYAVRLELEDYKIPIVEGTQWGFFVEKVDSQRSKTYSTSNELKNKIFKTQENISLNCVRYIAPGAQKIDWSNTSDAKVLVISDIHVGNMTFCKENFVSLLYKANREPKLKYVILNGDLVDGVEVYPGQKQDLTVESYEKQYDQLASYLQILRPDITIVLAPGNHDYVGRIEPQAFPPKIEQIFTKKLPKVVFGPNPGYYCIDGIYFYLTHGTSYNSLLKNVQTFDYTRCAQISQYLFSARNVSPIRTAVPVGPNKNLHHIIPEKTNVICSGHLHNQQVIVKENRLFVATGAWQQKTPYMDLLGIVPDVSTGVLIDLRGPGFYEEWDLKDDSTEKYTYHMALVQKQYMS